MTRPPTPLKNIPQMPLVGFQMFFPDFGGYTPDNYQDQFDEDIVNVVEVVPTSLDEAEMDVPGLHIPNVLKRLRDDPRPLISASYEEKFGLRCHEILRVPEGVGRKQYCFGQRDIDNDEYLLLEIVVPPFEYWMKSPQMQAKYFSKKYGGIQIAWRTHVKHLKDWHRIDQQIWTYIDAWNIAKAVDASDIRAVSQ